MNDHKKLIFILCNALFNDSLDYVILRNFEHLPYSTGGSDLDVIIFERDLNYFFKSLRLFVIENDVKVVSVIRNRKCIKVCLLRANSGVQIDIFVDSVFYGKNEIIPKDILRDSIINHRGLKVLNPKVGSLLAFLKELLNNKDCKLKYIRALNLSFSTEKVDFKYLKNFNSDFINYLNEHFLDLNQKKLKILYGLTKLEFNRNRKLDLKNIFSRLFYRPGFSIVLIGTDGAGKSTLIERIKFTLLEAFHNSVHIEHLRPNKIPSLARLFGRKEFNIDENINNPHRLPVSGFFTSLFRWGYYLVDYIFGYYIKVYPKISIKSSVWIFDRYYYDLILDPSRARISLPYIILKIGELIIPKPDIIFCLGTDPEIIHSRKPELPLIEVKRQVEELRKFCCNNSKAVWIDTGQDLNTSTVQILDEISNMMAIRFESFEIRSI